MSVSIPDSHRDLPDGRVYVHMAIYMKDGSHQIRSGSSTKSGR
jgi:hypothetical protein